jgi:hypothetical protein
LQLPRISLRRWALLTVALVAVAGLIYGAGSGARRSIRPPEHEPVRAIAPPAIPAPTEPASSVR